MGEKLWKFLQTFQTTKMLIAKWGVKLLTIQSLLISIWLLIMHPVFFTAITVESCGVLHHILLTLISSQLVVMILLFEFGVLNKSECYLVWWWGKMSEVLAGDPKEIFCVLVSMGQGAEERNLRVRKERERKEVMRRRVVARTALGRCQTLAVMPVLYFLFRWRIINCSSLDQGVHRETNGSVKLRFPLGEVIWELDLIPSNSTCTIFPRNQMEVYQLYLIVGRRRLLKIKEVESLSLLINTLQLLLILIFQMMKSTFKVTVKLTNCSSG
mmetsp:Transcript_16897/g.31751  ORF Transcript_16897/g.31751 Transcript_16897/m.31751 type:complete len:270 (-) Transcript_16897:606-1415(-)